MAAIQLQSVTKAFGKSTVIRGVDLDIGDKEFVVFVGPSGCGKSTLLRLLAGLEDVSDGRIAFDGEEVTDLPPVERGIAMVFQSYALYPHMTVFDNMAFGLKLARSERKQLEERVRNAARILRIDHLLDRKPRHLSGGQRQRVAIGRAIVRNPRVFLFDEPLSNLDAALRVQMRVEIAKLHRELDATMIYVTHDQVEAMTLADRIVVLNAGRVEQVGTPLELYRRPANRFVAGFIGSPTMNFVAATISGGDATSIRVTTDDGANLQLPWQDGMPPEPGAAVTIGVRPEHLSLDGQGELSLAGPVVAVEHLGGETYIHVSRDAGDTIVVRGDGNVSLRPGDRIELGARADACYLFDSGGDALGVPADDDNMNPIHSGERETQ